MQMKNLVMIASVSCLLLLIACNSNKSGGMSDKAKKNLETSQAIAKMFEAGDWSKSGDYIATDAVDHASMDGQDIKGIDNIKANFAKISTMMGNFKNETVKEIADDDYVFQWLKETATAKVDDPTMGMKAGQNMTISMIEVSKFNADGKVSEHWSFGDWGEMMKMMPKPSMDTTNMNKPK